MTRSKDGTARIARMWCANCQTDVAGEVSEDRQRLLCAACGCEVSSAKSPSLHPKTREVRELLQRWSTEELLDPDLPVRIDPELSTRPARSDAPADSPSIEDDPSLAAEEQAAAADLADTERPAKVSRPKFRLDGQHTPKTGSAVPIPAPHPPRTRDHLPNTRVDEPHAQSPAPHFDIASAFEGKKLPGRGESLWGQILAYGGVGLLTVGTAMVLWGYFGGPDSYTPTGWLLTTAGQMLLFLGVVTLVSGGMEQTTHEVSRHIQYLGDHIVRIERHTQEQALRGPHFAAGDESRSRRRETATASHHRSADG